MDGRPRGPIRDGECEGFQRTPRLCSVCQSGHLYIETTSASLRISSRPLFFDFTTGREMPTSPRLITENSVDPVDHHYSLKLCLRACPANVKTWALFAERSSKLARKGFGIALISNTLNSAEKGRRYCKEYQCVKIVLIEAKCGEPALSLSRRSCKCM